MNSVYHLNNTGFSFWEMHAFLFFLFPTEEKKDIQCSLTASKKNFWTFYEHNLSKGINALYWITGICPILN